MSFFVIQVRSGTEIKTRELLYRALEQKDCNEVKAVYAIDSYTEINEQKEYVERLLEESSVYNNLHTKRIKALLITLRQLETSGSHGDDLFEYQQEIKQLTEQLQQYRLQKKFNSIKGYILIETSFDCFSLSANLWQLIKQLPTVISIPSRYNVPLDEVRQMFEELEIPKLFEVETCMSEMVKGLIGYGESC